MVFKIDISDDFEELCSDFLHRVTLRIGEDDTVLSSVMSEPYEFKEADQASENGVTGQEMYGTDAQVVRQGTLFIWSKKRSVQPPLGSVIIDTDGVYWTVYRVTNKWHVETWEALGLNLNIISEDYNLATVLKASYVKGLANEAKAVWKGMWSGVEGGTDDDVVNARIQPSGETARLEFGADTSLEVYRVYFDDRIPFDLAGGEYRLVDSDGKRYRVTKYYNEERIDRLPVAICTGITEGAEFWGSSTSSGSSS